MKQTKNLTRQRIALIGLGSLFIVPVIVAWYLITYGQEWLPEGSAAHGELVHPARPLVPFVMDSLTGGEIDLAFMKDKWTLVSFADPICTEECETILYNMRQVRLAQGGEMKRVQRLLVISSDLQINLLRAALKPILQQHQGLQVGVGQKAMLLPFLTQLQTNGSDDTLANAIFIIDPKGNIVMRYPKDSSLKGMAKDLTRLLKASYIG